MSLLSHTPVKANISIGFLLKRKQTICLGSSAAVQCKIKSIISGERDFSSQQSDLYVTLLSHVKLKMILFEHKMIFKH